MAGKKWEIITSGIMILTLVILFIADIIYRSPLFYLISIIICTLIYFTICYLQIKRISTLKWKMIVVATFVVATIIIFPMHFVFSPLRLDFELPVLFGVDIVVIVVFLMLTFMQDMTNTILVAILATIPVCLLLYLHDGQRYTELISICILAGENLIIVWLYVKKISNHRWKVAPILAFVLIIISMVLIFHSDMFDNDKYTITFSVLIIINAPSAFVLLLWMYIPKVMAWRNVYMEQEILQSDEYNFLEIAGLPTRFALHELNAATGNFGTPIGMGGSGAVFKGVMGDGSTVAVKRIKGQASGEQEFRTEITIIASLQHVNLVRLVGYCLSPRGDRYLIYPFIENGSLDSWLFAEEEKRSHLTWMLRYNIAIAVARALAYLHNECHHRILHLDVKPANILLEGEFKALLADFGISKSIDRNQSSVMTRVRGTIGYLPPEMLVSNAISTKSDVYSYGMVLLELIGGRKNFQSTVDEETGQRRNSYFPQIAREKMIGGKLMEVVDKTLIQLGDLKEDEVTIVVQVALWCIQENPELRPTMTKVVDMLEGRTAVQMPPESPMLVINFLDAQSQSSALGDPIQVEENAPVSANTISLSILSGR
ncbi:hypothetical protein LUZ60_000603 [Juncus effusus]|nr:hypothetical protein LUZ60_000603 [Juncus effusus]